MTAIAVASVDVPQANRLDVVRRVVEVVAAGVCDPAEIGRNVRLSTRHTNYYLHAARVLGWVTMQRSSSRLTELGRNLLHTKRGSAAERRFIGESLAASPVLARMVGDLLERGLERETIVSRLVDSTELSPVTAARRAGTLMQWRDFVLNEKARRRAQRRKKRKTRRTARRPSTPVERKRPADAETIAQALRRKAPQTPTLESDVEQVLTEGLTAGEADMALAWIDWEAASARSLDEATTRNAVSGIAQQLRRRRRPTPRLNRALRLIGDALPAREQDLHRALCDAELMRPTTHLRAVAEAARIVGYRIPFVRHPADPFYLLPAENISSIPPRATAQKDEVVVEQHDVVRISH